MTFHGLSSLLEAPQTATELKPQKEKLTRKIGEKGKTLNNGVFSAEETLDQVTLVTVLSPFCKQRLKQRSFPGSSLSVLMKITSWKGCLYITNIFSIPLKHPLVHGWHCFFTAPLGSQQQKGTKQLLHRV